MRRGFALACLPMIVAACSDAGSAVETDTADAAFDATADAADAGLDASRVADATAPDARAVVDAGPCGADMALLTVDASRVCINLYEGALVVALPDGGEAPWPYDAPVDALDAGTFRAVVARGHKPQGYISSLQAAGACEASGKRLCTLEEWTTACRGRPEHDYVYPYGDAYESGACNEGKPSPILELFGTNANYSAAELSDPRCDELEGGLANGGDYPRCVSAYGTFDMHGNLHEWVDDHTSSAGHGTFMGGYFVDATLNGAGCTYRTTAHATTYHDYSTGFRCCGNPK